MKRLLHILFLFLILKTSILPQQIKEIIPVQNLTSGETKTIPISDLFFSKSYDAISFRSDTLLKIQYDRLTHSLSITPSKNAEGYVILPFSSDGKNYSIVCKTELKQKVTFTYSPEDNSEHVNLFGSFNGWNRESHPMVDKNNDGVFSIDVFLDAGRYEYKFYVAGEEITDPLNPEQTPNGFGGWNSVISVKPRFSGKAYLHKMNSSFSVDRTVLTFYYETDSTTEPEIVALLDNEKVPRNVTGYKEGYVFIDIPSEKLKGNRTLRVGVNDNGRASNLQTVILTDGKPLAGNEFLYWNDAIIYSIMIDRFFDGDSTNSIPVEHPELSFQANYQGGDLRGIIDKLEEGYFDKLGINTFWLSPVIDNTDKAYKEFPPPHRYYTGYHGYWPVHPEKVEERFGDMDLLKKLIRLAHSKGIKVLLDFVANHVHEEHPFWKENRNWFGVLELPDGSLNLRKWDEHRLTTWFEPYMPSFDYEGSEEALEVMTDNAVWWLKETGADGFRHDAVKHVPNSFWRMLTGKINREIAVPENKTVYQIGETFGSYELVSSYVNNGQLSSQFNFNLYDTAIPVFTDETASFIALDEQLRKTHSVYGVNHLMGNVMDSHDKVRFMAYADGDVLHGDDAGETGWTNPPHVDNKSSYDKLKLYLAYMLSIPGVPVIYYGSEIGMTGAADPDNRRMMRFDDELSEWESETLAEVRKIVQLRNRHSSLRHGDFLPVHVSDNVYAYIRSDMNERVLVVLNKSGNSVKPEINIPSVYGLTMASCLLSGEKFAIEKNVIAPDLKERGFLLLKLE